MIGLAIAAWVGLLILVLRWEGRGRHLGRVRAFYALCAFVCVVSGVVGLLALSWWRVALNAVAGVAYVRWYNRASDRHAFEKITREMTP